jgi:predicted permease
MHRLIAVIHAISGSTRADDDFRAELESHLAMDIERYVRRGMSPDEARRAALVASGGLTVASEIVHERRGLAWAEDAATDLRYARRSLRRKPAFALAGILTLGLAVGANAAMFTIVNAVVLRALPYAAPDRIVSLSLAFKGVDREVVPEQDYFAWLADARSATLAAYSNARGVVAMPTGPEEIRGLEVTAPYFAVLGVRPLLGRTFTPEEDRPGAHPVVVIGEQLWRRGFAADSGIVGRLVTIDGKSRTVVGVLPAAFWVPSHGEYWQPFQLSPSTNGTRFYYEVIARLRDGATVEGLKAELGAITKRIDTGRAVTERDLTPVVMTLHDRLYGERRTPLLLLFGAVGVLLLIACANLANLSLARATSRQREIAVRLALGAGRWRLVRYMLAESLLLSAAGAVLGLFLSEAAVRYFTQLSPAAVGKVEGIRADARVLAFTLVVAAATGVVVGLVAALYAARQDPQRALAAGSTRASAGVRHPFLRSLLVVGQLATALVLLTAAGLVARTFARVASINPGFEPEGLVVATIRLPEPRYSDTTATPFYEQFLERVRRVPGVETAAMADAAPLSGMRMSVSMKDSAGRETPRIDVVAVGPDYFRTVGARIIAGRPIDNTDRAGSTRAIMVNATLAHQRFPGATAVGRTIPFQGRATVVGVVRDVLQRDVEIAPTPMAYPSLAQEGSNTYMRVMARTSGSVPGLEAAMAQISRAMDPTLPPPAFKRMDEALADSIAPRKFTFVLLGIFAALAATLAVVGLYGVLAHVVADRTREIGIRAALGADRRRVLGLIMKQGGLLVTAGIAGGMVGAAALTRLITGLLYGVSPRDPLTLTAVPLLLGGVAMLATLVPAWRAARVDPVIALRAD